MTGTFSQCVARVHWTAAAAGLQVILTAVAALPATAQNQATQRYLLTVDACMPDVCSTGPSGQLTYLLQSADGLTWSLVPGFTPFQGGVAGIVRRGNTIYIVSQAPPSSESPVQFSAMQTVKYHTDTGVEDAPVPFIIQDAQYPAGTYQLQDPSLSLNPQGQLVIDYDVASIPGPDCPSGTCHIRMAIEVAGSDGTAFATQTNDAVTYSATVLGDPSRPFFDGTQWIFYAGASAPPPATGAELVFTASSFAGPYSLYSGLPSGELTTAPIGQISGFYDAAQSQYWDYFSTSGEIGYIALPSLTQQITSAESVNPTVAVNNTTLGTSGETIQHPHFATNCCHTGTDTHDFNADGTSDILWRDSSGNLAMWLMSNGQMGSGAAISTVPTSWSIVGTRDFNGDGDADILWQDTNGDLAVWLMNLATLSSGISLGTVGGAWSVTGTGDFNGDGTGDILWRNGTSGDVAIWLMNNGKFSSGVDLGVVPLAWTVAGTGDFNGDGITDILWRNTSTGDLAIWLLHNGQFSSGADLGAVSLTWSVVGTGDFNGDGTSDILWRDSSGNVAIWLISNGQFSSGASLGQIPTKWSVAETGDFNSDGTSDILWLDQSGDLAVWLMNGASLGSGLSLGNVGTSWQVQGQNAD